MDDIQELLDIINKIQLLKNDIQKLETQKIKIINNIFDNNKELLSKINIQSHIHNFDE